MIGCHAHALSAELTVDHTELEEADWFTRSEVAAAMAGDEDGRFIAPPPQAIAHHLLKWWLNQ
jgi:NAD+ diphosphatase